MELDAGTWSIIKDRIKLRNKENKLVETWLDPVQFLETSQEGQVPKMVLGVPTSLHQYFVVENLLDKIFSEIAEHYKSPFEVDVVITGVKHASAEPGNLSEAMVQLDRSHQGVRPPQSTTPPPFEKPVFDKKFEVLNPEYTFSTFVVGKSTEFAHAASYNVAKNPGENYNPLVICGPVGMGKTHLLHAVGNQIRETYPDCRIVYTSAERFLNECISALRRQDMERFRHKYRESADILLVDDVQYISRGERIQEEFFHMINSFLERKKQVVLASDRFPKDIQKLEDRNRSRLEWGLIVDISMPDLETRVAILRYKAERMGLRLPEDVINYIARISKISIRELEGNLKRVKMFSELQGLPVDSHLAKKVLANQETQTTISMEDIQRLVAEHYNVKVQDLKSTTRAKQIVVPRQVAMHLIKKHLSRSLVDIGRAFGGKDHTTVMNALERVTFLTQSDLDLKNDLDELTTRIQNITGV